MPGEEAPCFAYVILTSKIKINGSVVIFEEPCSDIMLIFFSYKLKRDKLLL